MTTFKRFTFGFALLLMGFGSLLQAQTVIPTTTLSAGLTGIDSSSAPGSATDVIQIASTSNFVQNSVGQWTTGLYVDFEYMDVVTVINSTAGLVRVVRGAGGTKSTSHNSGATVYVGAPNYFGGSAAGGAALSGDKLGSCVAANEPYLPAININDGKIFQCLSSGQWVQTGFGTMGTPPGQTISAFCTATVGSAQTEYLNSAACSGATTLTATRVITTPGTLWGLQVYSSAAVVGGSSKDVATVYKNGSATAITCTIAASGTTCSDLTHSVATAVGDVIAVQFVTATSDTAANVSATLEKQ